MSHTQRGTAERLTWAYGSQVPLDSRSLVRVRFPVLALVLTLSAGAQEKPAAVPFRESVDVTIINIDVRVTDKSGNPIRDLKQSDFEVLENGKRQIITNFSEYRSARAEPSPPRRTPNDVARPSTGGDKVAELKIRRVPRTFVLVIDQLPFGTTNRKPLFDNLRQFFRDSMTAEDQALVVGWREGAHTMLDLTQDRESVDRVLARLSGQQDLDTPQAQVDVDARFNTGSAADAASDPSLGAAERQTLFSAVEEQEFQYSQRRCADLYLAEMRKKASALRGIITSLRGGEHKKTLIYVSNRFPHNTQTFCATLGSTAVSGSEDEEYNTASIVRSITRAASAEGVVFYVLRPEIPATFQTADRNTSPSMLLRNPTGTPGARDQIALNNETRSLSVLTRETGGILATSMTEIEKALPRMIEDLDSYYSIGYRGSGRGKDASRELNVRLRNRGYIVRTRRSIVNKSNATQARDQLVENLFSSPNPGELSIELVTSQPRPQARNRYLLPVEVRVPVSELTFVNDKGLERASVVVLITSASGFGANTRITEDRVSVTLSEVDGSFVTYKTQLLYDREGSVTSIGVFDETSGLAGYAVVDRRKPSTSGIRLPDQR